MKPLNTTTQSKSTTQKYTKKPAPFKIRTDIKAGPSVGVGTGMSPP